MRPSLRRPAFLILLALCGASACIAPSFAEPLSKSQIPEPLRPWTDWVLHGHEEAACPFFPASFGVGASGGEEGGDAGAAPRRQCLWPSRLGLDLADRGGRFTQEWLVLRDDWVPLPGDATNWPQGVAVDGHPVAVMLRGEDPSVRLLAGRRRLTGRFEWRTPPPLLRVPAETGLLDLVVRGRTVASPVRDAEGRVWLQKQEGQGEEESRLTLAVSRRAEDDLPFRLLTRVDLRVSGRSREVNLGQALPGRFVPMALRSPFPARIDDRGRLIAQVRPGVWALEIDARHEGPVEELSPPPAGDPWPQDETWVFLARPELRQVRVEGAAPVDPQQTTLPAEWKSLPAYVLRAGAGLRLVEKQRGDADPAPDQLTLERTLWLDFDGAGYTAHDRIAGSFVRSWRIEMPDPALLGRVAIDGVDQLITRRAPPSPAGVEIRQGAASVEADSRLPGRPSALKALGWEADFQKASIDLRLPPGWRLLHAGGVDDVDATWISAWTLLDLFLVFVIVLGVAHLWGRTWGVVSLLALGMSWIEYGAPRWTWVGVVAAAALAAVLQQGRIRGAIRLVQLATIVVLLVVLVPFLVGQVRAAIYPALEEPMDAYALLGRGGIAAILAPNGYGTAAGDAEEGTQEHLRSLGYVNAQRSQAEGSSSASGVVADMAAIAGRGGYAGKSSNLALDPRAAAQTGPGLPSWGWRRVALAWRGPVSHAQEMRLYLLSPGVGRFLAIVRAALLAALAFLILRRGLVTVGTGPARRTSGGGATLPVTALVALPLVLGVTTGVARADTPTPDLLHALQERLLEPPTCGQDCVTLPRLSIEAAGMTARVRAEMHAAAAVAAPLPGGADAWNPARVLLDGAPASGLARIGGRLFIALGPGTHQVLLEGPLVDRDAVSIPLPLRPRRVEVRAEGWRVDGVSEDGTAEDTLQLVRLRPRAGAGGAIESGSLPPFVRVDRELEIGLRWEVRTRVVRLTPPGAAILIQVPLLPGESVTSADVRVSNGRAQVSLPPDGTEMAWSSALAEVPEIRLQAPDVVPWVETWRAAVGPVWHVESEGIPPMRATEATPLRTREWRPWPGESLLLRVTRPDAVEGDTLTIDSATLTLSPGLRLTDAGLDLSVRASRGGEQSLTLPQGAELQAVTINTVTQAIRQEGARVVLPIAPGRQAIHLDWREPRGIGILFRTPEVGLGAHGVNLTTVISLPSDRWTWFLGGPRLGPAVLFWGVLVVSLLLSIGLGSLRFIPLRWPEWFLLSLGLTQVPIAAALAIVGWLLALGWRRRSPQPEAFPFDLVQLLLVAWTITALVLLFWAIQRGLLGLPEMQIAGNGSTARSLRWYLDRTSGTLPRPWVLSVPLLVYRIAMLAWALWLARAVLRWLRWGWECLGEGGLWRPLRRPKPPSVPPTPDGGARGAGSPAEGGAPPVVA